MNEKLSDNQVGKYKQLWLVFFTIFFINIFVFIFIALLMKPLWYDINEFLKAMIGVQTNWLAIVLTLTFLILGYSVFLLIFYLIKRIKIGITKPHLANRIIPFPLILIWNFMLYLLISESGDEVTIVRTQLENISPIILLILILGLSSTLLFIIPKLGKVWSNTTRKSPKTITLTILITILFLTVFILPFVIVPSNIVSSVPIKPKIIAHRGASHLAPENTIAAGEQAVTWNAFGWEVDVAISYDGILFLMHDTNLKRTTNVEEIFPERQNELAENFSFSDLRTLDAGSWFAENDPYDTISKGIVSESLANSYIGEKIPSLAEVINLTRDNDLVLDIDYRRPTSSHPFYNTYFDVLLTQLNDAGLNKKIFISSSLHLAENMTHVCGADSVEVILANVCELVNTHHGLTNKEFYAYEEANIAVMVWTVDTSSRFSQLWCLGVDYIKTNSLHLFTNITEPTWTLIPRNYYIAWAIIDFSLPLSFILLYIIKSKKKIVE
ncbi:MAG TPA: glycerophosphodiester phosphodiesterase family protein [Candidatus Bathyarchaeia archaeon]|nr:glycerophosphodiester phosphodiesterase family protein [Candidatus Bathyarchaeia archaeon]